MSPSRRPSEIIRRLTGYAVESRTLPTPATLKLLTQSCRDGELRAAAETFIESQPEDLSLDTLVVEYVDSNRVTGRVFGKTEDREAPSPFDVEVAFELDPKTGQLQRLN